MYYCSTVGKPEEELLVRKESDNVRKASTRAPETHEKTLHRQEQNPEHIQLVPRVQHFSAVHTHTTCSTQCIVHYCTCYIVAEDIFFNACMSSFLKATSAFSGGLEIKLITSHEQNNHLMSYKTGTILGWVLTSLYALRQNENVIFLIL